MSLDICAVNKERAAREKEEIFTKYQLPDSLRSKSNDDILEWLDQALARPTKLQKNWLRKAQKALNVKLEKDESFYESPKDKLILEAEDLFEDVGFEKQSFHIGYAHFSMVRESMAPLYGAKYYYAKHDKLNRPIFDSYTFSWPSDWANTKYGDALYNFFMHPDNEDEYSEKDIKEFSRYNKEHHIYEKAEKLDLRDDVKEPLLKLLKFIDFSAQNNDYWIFL